MCMFFNVIPTYLWDKRSFCYRLAFFLCFEFLDVFQQQNSGIMT
ncbi:MAG: hypothetical protein ACI93N_001034 [Flavobacteriaceae bacterium]|jgi:hypothetical protein